MNPYSNHKNLKCVVLCAGPGERICPALKEAPKAMIPLSHKPIIQHVVDYWQDFAQEFVFVVGYKKEEIIEFIKNSPRKISFVEQKRPRGIADAIYCARDDVSEHFIVVLGDCLAKGVFEFPEKLVQGVGVYQTKDPEQIKQSYSVNIKHNLISQVKEKPKVLPNNLCGMGFYFFDRRVFSYIEQASPSKLRNEIEITDVIQMMIDNQELISPVFFQGSYLNINYPEDLQRAEKIF